MDKLTEVASSCMAFIFITSSNDQTASEYVLTFVLPGLGSFFEASITSYFGLRLRSFLFADAILILDFSILTMYHMCSVAISTHLSVNRVIFSSEQVQEGEHLGK